MNAPVNARASAALEAQRLRGIRAIKATQRALALDDGAYRAMLFAQTGKSSAAELTVAEQARVLDHLRRAYAAHPGAANPAEARRREARAGARKRGTPAADKAPMLSALHSLLRQLGDVIGEPVSLNYADAICRRNGWCERVDFASAHQLHMLLGALARTLRSKADERARSSARTVEDPA